MAIDVYSRMKTLLRTTREKKRRSNDSTSPCKDRSIEGRNETTNTATPVKIIKPEIQHHLGLSRTETKTKTAKHVFSEQLESSFFKKLPLEIRNMIYGYLWQGPNDHRYHESRGRHLHFKDGHWVHTRCVMYPEDEDLDRIQMHMDSVRRTGRGDLLLWQQRLASPCGHRHWRCEERVKYGEPTSIDRTDLGAVMRTCKKMYPEAMQSFLEEHKIIFYDLFSAYRFFVQPGSPHIRHIRRLDLALHASFYELSPFVAIGAAGTDEKPDQHSLRRVQASQLGAVLGAVADRITCLHSLRISLDVYNLGPWRRVPELAISTHLLERIKVRSGKNAGGKSDYVVELPAALPIQTHYAGLRYVDDANIDSAEGQPPGRAQSRPLPYNIVRRPALRYWQFTPGEVEHFTWETCHDQKKRKHCWIALSKNRIISNPHPNPYLIDFTERRQL